MEVSTFGENDEFLRIKFEEEGIDLHITPPDRQDQHMLVIAYPLKDGVLAPAETMAGHRNYDGTGHFKWKIPDFLLERQ